MKIGVLKETASGERRVALVPSVVQQLSKNGMEVLVQAQAGEAAGIPDASFTEKGAKILATAEEVIEQSDILAVVRAEWTADSPVASRLKPDQIVIGLMDPLSAPERVSFLSQRNVTAFAMEMIPRITRAQSMDALSSMATIAGYKAVIMAADTLPRLFPMLTTAAGTISPARVFVIGAGVAGLQAIATARRLGAVVHAYDVRPAVKEQVQSLGAKFVEMELAAESAEDKGGYAKAQDEEFYKRQRELMHKVVATNDVVITTAAVPGMRAPVLITREMLAAMPPGSVVVDLAAERGGNCEATRPGETVVESGVTVMGPLNVPSTIPFHASQMYARNVAALLNLLVAKGELKLNMDDEIIRETVVTLGGEVTNERIKGMLNKPAS